MPYSLVQFPAQHMPLRDDLAALDALLRDVLREQAGAEVLRIVEHERAGAVAWRAQGPGDGQVPRALLAEAAGRPPGQVRELVRAFSSWFQLANVAEKVHRIRRRREYFKQDSERPQPGGVEDALGELKAAGLGLEEVLELLGQLSIEPVLLAHPMESTRRTTLRRQQRLADLLVARDNPSLAPYERQGLMERIRAEIGAEWQTEEHPRDRLTVADEREHAIFYLAEVLYRIVPSFYQEICVALGKLYGVDPLAVELPIMVRFGTSVGADMEASTDVHAKSVRDTLARAQQTVIDNYQRETLELAQFLSHSANRVGVDPQISARIEEYTKLLPGAQGLAPSRHDRMPYRALLTQIAQRLQATNEGRACGYEHPSQFRTDVALIAQSLRANRGVHAGYFQIRRLLYRIDTFGFHLASLDLKAHSSMHHAVLAQGLGDADWDARSPAERHARLVEVLERDVGPVGPFDAIGKRALAVFDAITHCRHRYGAEAIGLYVVSGVSQPDDVLAPLVLARWAGAYDKRTGQVALDVAPLFDRVETLENCGSTMRELLSDSVYKRHLEARRRQTVLIGFSESNQASGIVASRLAAYHAQRQLTHALREANKQHVLCYSRGGSIPRGGGRIDALLRGAPAESVSGVLRFTEQGEAVAANYGLRPNAIRTLERALATLGVATLAVRRGVAVRESAALASCVELIAERSAAHWRALVYDEPDFLDYFRSVTPIDVIERMQIGVNPARRTDRSGIEAVLPVAWVFAWSQSRHMLPGWYGAGSGLSQAREQRGIELLRLCYRGWPLFRNLLDDIDAMLARTDLAVAACYDRLAGAPLAPFAVRIGEEFARTRDLVLEIKEANRLVDTDRTLQRGIALRNPQVDSMNFMQVDLLARWRAGGRRDRELFEALQASVTGISRGLQTTG